jgi:hypothetical protein
VNGADDSSTDASDNLPQDVATAVTSALRKAELDADVQSLSMPGAEGAVSNLAAPVSQGTVEGPVQSGPMAAAPPTPAKDLAGTLPDVPTNPTEPLRNISLQIDSPTGDKPVRVDLVQRAGELAISVRANGSDVANSLRHDLPELTNKLAEHGFAAETWHPAASTAPANSGAESGNNQNLPQQGHSQSQQNGSQQKGNQEEGGQSNPPRWFEQMQATLQNNSSPIGELHGLTS